MSRDPNITMPTSNNTATHETDSLAVLIKKVEGKRKILGEARAIYSKQCIKVEKDKSKLREIKVERFKMEALLQESEIRVKVYKKREKELRDECERARKSIQQAEEHQKHEYGLRDVYTKDFRRKVVELAEHHRQFRKSCDQNAIDALLQELRAADDSITNEIEQFLKDSSIKSDNTTQGISTVFMAPQTIVMVSPTDSDQDVIHNICELRTHVKQDIERILENNAKLQIDLDQLEARKTSLQLEINALKEILEK